MPKVLRLLGVIGQWSLSYYMLHQPVLIGGLMLFAGQR
jgi:peptidoglycan/LPS O-acetylase OafA/YrhL